MSTILANLLLLLMVANDCVDQVSAQAFTQQRNPIITKVSPTLGGYEGGTELHISGANFVSDYLFTEAVVFIGNEICKVINYKTNANKIVCITPKCFDPACASAASNNAMVQQTLSVYVATSEGVLYDDDTFTYSGYYTNRMNAMQTAAYATATAWLNVYTRNTEMTDVDMLINDQYRADFGDDGELNISPQQFYDSEKVLFYHPPIGMPAGYYNLSFTTQNHSNVMSTISTGTADMHAEDRGDPRWYRFYLFDATLTGTVHSFQMLPVISDVQPRSGSLAGGTSVTIQGSGFSANSSELLVYISGVPCAVKSSTTESIVCVTQSAVNRAGFHFHLPGVNASSAAYTPSSSNLVYSADAINNTSAAAAAAAVNWPFELPSARAVGVGSPGWWVKMWNYNDHRYGTKGQEDHVKLSFGVHQKFYLSMYEQVSNVPDYYWYDKIGGIDGTWPNYYYYRTDSATVFTAPLAGFYTFYLTNSYYGYLYGSTEDVGVNEVLLCQSTRRPSMGDYYSQYNSVLEHWSRYPAQWLCSRVSSCSCACRLKVIAVSTGCR